MRILDINKYKQQFLQVENPSRYTGGEFHYGKKELKETDLKCAICFPDLYEIGMSNNAIRIIYDLLNKIDGIYCDHLFAVAPDAEKMFRENKIPLYTTTEHMYVKDLDYLGFSIGYELCATCILQVLDLSGIPLRVQDRTDDDPITIGGGPASTNPLPFSGFLDFVQIGEAEAGSEEILRILQRYKTRKERLNELKKLDFLWYPGKEKTIRAIHSDFSKDGLLEHFVVPNMKVVQDHGYVEIMRGCPNGCRFCHAGQYYKPFRQKSLSSVYNIVQQYVDEFGYRNITLSSLSTGDYPNLDKIMYALNRDFSSRQVSFALPSLKVNTFSLNILEQISQVRKSGLTFAIETPFTQWQHSLNKEVNLEDVISIIQEAKSRGWKKAKFYFMTGLPFTDLDKEEQGIVDFLTEVYKVTRINMSLTIATYIPKAHTPFQWVPQLRPEIGLEHLQSIKRHLQNEIRGIKVSYHDPKVSYIEGVMSRGGADCTEVIMKAYQKGCRLDSWEEHVKYDLWIEAIDELNYKTNIDGFSLDDPLPWDNISLRVSKGYLKKEYEKAKNSITTLPCSPECSHNCGVCKDDVQTVSQRDQDLNIEEHQKKTSFSSDPTWAIFEYSKTGAAVFCSHINTMRNFEMALQRADINVRFTEGYNPKPRMEFLNPLSLGVAGKKELLLCQIYKKEGDTEENIASALNSNLSEGFHVNKLVFPPFKKKTSLASIMTGSVYEILNIKDPEIIEKLQDSELAEKTDEKWIITLPGEKNLFKTVFGKDMNKFNIAGSSDIVRKEVLINGVTL